MRSSVIALAIVAACVAPAALGTTYYVDGTNGNDAWDGLCQQWDGGTCGPKATIQAALDLGSDGDEVIVAPGTYYENIFYDGKNIELRAENPSVDLADPLDPGAASIIDGSQPSDPDFGSAVRFLGTELPGCTLDGFTVTGGTGTMGTSFTEGGGIFGGDEGQMWTWTQATIVNCTITDNTARFGAGLSQCGGTIRNCNITGNWTDDPGGSNHGGGGLAACNGTIRDCTVSGNTAYEGGALYSCRGLIVNCDITGNEVLWSGGAMIYCDDATVVNCNVSDNAASLNGYGAGGVVFSSRITFVNCTLADNSAITGGAIYGYHSFTPTISNCIIWGNTATNGSQIALNSTGQPTTLVIEYTDLEGGEDGIYLGDPDNCFVEWGDGMLEVDPLFTDSANGDFRLLPCSPCIDAANNNAVPADDADLDDDGDTAEPTPLDLDGNPRFVDDPYVSDTGNGTPPIVDMGAYEFQADCPGDLDRDGDVDQADLGILLAAWASSGEGDLDCDGDTDQSDLGILLANWGCGT